jgi:hypothetical protein
MAYVMLDPPVNAFSPKSKVQAWIERLEALSREPEFSAGQGRDAIEAALIEAHSWLDPSPSELGTPAAGAPRP